MQEKAINFTSRFPVFPAFCLPINMLYVFVIDVIVLLVILFSIERARARNSPAYPPLPVEREKANKRKHYRTRCLPARSDKAANPSRTPFPPQFHSTTCLARLHPLEKRLKKHLILFLDSSGRKLGKSLERYYMSLIERLRDKEIIFDAQRAGNRGKLFKVLVTNSGGMN